ncbi:hypothetical protein BDY21DRAFT_142186 [Lineolata rhizophorae]|uniref:Secreted protein n=1 Tax=Lineolata rhizophorae TaxID=578093 RepID=A0A6A6NN91_9PEZI|nr:hypothetical protein BDY21DRAFT_142186 [Lineolata rhizophorae]
MLGDGGVTPVVVLSLTVWTLLGLTRQGELRAPTPRQLQAAYRDRSRSFLSRRVLGYFSFPPLDISNPNSSSIPYPLHCPLV